MVKTLFYCAKLKCDMFITINNITLHYKLDGFAKGTPIVFINSLGSDLRIWDDVAARLQHQHRIVRYDKRGHGLSSCPSGPYTMMDHAVDLVGLLDYLQIETAVLCGISVGGMIAQNVALAFPDRVRILILCDTGAKIGTTQSWNDRIGTVQQHGMGAIAEAILARWFTSAYRQQCAADYAGYAAMLERTSAVGYAGTCAALRDADFTADVARIDVPTLVLCGDQDSSTPPALSEALHNRIGGAQMVLIENAAHLPCIEQPAVMAKEIDVFLQSKIQNLKSKMEAGMVMRREVLGDAHVDRVEANKTDFDADFQKFITETAWGSVWTRGGIDRKTRHLLTIVLMAELGKEHELAMHIRATRNTGVTPDEVKEALMQVAVYAGVPAANVAFGVAKRTFLEMK